MVGTYYSTGMQVSIILIRPQMGENIGATARAMANFGLRDLRLVAPRDGWPNPKATDMAGRAIDLLDDAKLFGTAEEAVADCQYVLAATARDRAVNMPSFTTRDAMAELRGRAMAGEKVAVMFGPERTGLENDEVALADGVLSIPVADQYPSLNLAQAVVVVASEWFAGVAEPRESTLEAIAPREQLQGLVDQLEAELGAVNFWRVPEKKDGMMRNIRAVLTRAQMSPQEVATWRGIVKSLSGK